ncbi:hypothetical protein RP20_CCG016854 [Aedes albopictus]|nr:hypothetical protein RP20_CCG016854 [Aedes albopictus]
MFAGIRSEIQSERTPKWTYGRQVRIFVNGLFFYQSAVTALQMFYVGYGKNVAVDFQTIFMITKIVGVIAVLAKWLLLMFQKDSVCTVLNFITSKRVKSGDDAHDELAQKQFNRSACTMMRISFAMTAANAVLLFIPSEITEQALGMPPPLTRYGKLATRLFYLTSTQLMFLGIVPKFLSNMVCIGMLIMGMRCKLEILAHRYKCVLSQPFVNPEIYFSRLEQDVREVLNQQMEYWRHFAILQTLVEKAFFIAHFYAMYSIGSCLFLSHKTGFNFLSGTLVSLSVAYVLKYYMWCYLVDSVQDVGDAIGDLIYEHCAQMPYSRKHHAQYVRMKSSLVIIWMNTRTGYSMSCMGMLEITTKTFVSFLNVVYSVTMFLINMV